MNKLKDWLKYLAPFTVAVLIFAFITQYDQTTSMFGKLLDKLIFLVSRFAIGFGVAYFLNFPMRYLERKFKFKRWLSITLTYVMVIALLALMVMFVVPSMVESIQQILGTSQTYYSQIQGLLSTWVPEMPEEAYEFINGILRQAADGVMNYLRTLMAMDVLGQFVSRSVRTLANIVFGLFISFYALWSKEKLASACKRFIFAVFPRKKADGVLSLSTEADINFSKFIVGKIWDSLIIGVISFVAYMIFGLPVSVFLAVVAAVTNMVPYFGPVVGGVITGIILLGFNPMYMLTGVLIVIAVQSLDGAVIGPKILSDACGLSALMIIISITIGGDLFGLWGILFAVPVVGTFKNVIVEKVLNNRLKSRGLDVEEPEKTPEDEIDGQVEM